MPNKHNIRKWVDALRSGEYKQTRSTLRDRNGYCCLGVACDISGLGEWSASLLHGYAYLGQATTLPVEVQKWLGVNNPNPQVWFGDTTNGLDLKRRPLSILNDSYRCTFEQIADAIENIYL